MAESISQGTLARFAKSVGDKVEADEEVATIETDDIAEQTGPRTEEPVKCQQEGERKHQSDTSARSPQPVEAGERENQQSQPPQQESQRESPRADPREQEQLSSAQYSPSGSLVRNERSSKLSRMRQTIAKRLKESQNRTASLTTMQCVDMSSLIAWRKQYKDEVMERYGVRLGYMGAFIKAATLAMHKIPVINASMDTEKSFVTFRDYVDISVAVSTPKGLVTPVVRNCETMSIIDIERVVATLAKKARESKLTMEDISGGNFSISNPGIFGSMFGTPLINYPQSAVFNINSIMEEPVVVNGKIEIRPLMYITITYDHRLIDGREAVIFLNLVKRSVEDPAKMLLA